MISSNEVKVLSPKRSVGSFPIAIGTSPRHIDHKCECLRLIVQTLLFSYVRVDYHYLYWSGISQKQYITPDIFLL